MRIAGIYPQALGSDPKIQHAVSEPYGLEMILAVAQQAGHDVELFVPARENNGAVVHISEDEMIHGIEQFKPDVAAFSLYTCQYPAGKKIAAKLREDVPGAVLVAGNRYPTYHRAAEEPFDFFVLKEGEETFRELLSALESGSDISDVNGISFNRNGQTIVTPIRKRITDLDNLPDAARFPVILGQVYRGISLPPLSRKPHYAIVEYSRCCYNSCSFCDNQEFWGRQVVFRPASRVIEEMKNLQQKGVDIFYFMDLNFTAFPSKTDELCDEMLKAGLDASWYCMSNISTAGKHPELLEKMKKAGCFKIAWGVESTSDRSLEMMRKKTGKTAMTYGECMAVLQRSLEAGILNQGYYIIGFPWETEQTIIHDAQSLADLPIHQLNIGIFTPIPLSRFHASMSQEGYTFDENLERHDRNHLVYNHATLTDEKTRELQQHIYDDFYASRQYSRRLEQTCDIEPHFRDSFSDYFNSMGGFASGQPLSRAPRAA